MNDRLSAYNEAIKTPHSDEEKDDMCIKTAIEPSMKMCSIFVKR